MTDLEFMERALLLARRGLGKVSPNPAVGAVLVKQGRIVGEGFHQYQGLKHAEVLACEQAGDAAAAGAALYLNLEPCAHQGRTGPCCDYLIARKIARVVAAMQDPHPLVSGRGFQRLREAGVQVDVGLLEKEAGVLNEGFSKFVTSGDPFATLKSALSLDGKIAGPRVQSREFFSGPESAARTEGLRLQADAICVGAGTVLADDPLLTYRGPEPRRRPLVRIVLDPHGRIAPDRRMFADPSPIWWVRPALHGALPPHVSLMQPGQGNAATWKAVLKRMAFEGMYHLLIEGGGETNAAALQAGIVDKILLIYAPRLIGGRATTGVIGGAGFDPAIPVTEVTVTRVGADFWIEGYLR
ncbi:MAG: bifunctional diaminohydroxyphosphoribosylaminopyrimidine deaminase/5-amino-6-(5-phosphoribosylamino)uracil reductase RibD [Acidobacteria bacterium]|nr:bifunctional diaminohydroxyphosphoribosylaminopyrimidine deaminase/5-amino-6-(5-phosphoribosylamino)uracil reductase RibD [Acidobacteriota bacterium]